MKKLKIINTKGIDIPLIEGEHPLYENSEDSAFVERMGEQWKITFKIKESAVFEFRNHTSYLFGDIQDSLTCDSEGNVIEAWTSRDKKSSLLTFDPDNIEEEKEL